MNRWNAFAEADSNALVVGLAKQELRSNGISGV